MFCCCRPTLLFVAPSTTQHFPSMRPFFSTFCRENGRCCRFSSSLFPIFDAESFLFAFLGSNNRRRVVAVVVVGSQQKRRGSLIFGRSVGDIQPFSSVPANFHFIESFSRIFLEIKTIASGRPIVRRAHDLSSRWKKTIRRLLFWNRDAAQQSPPHQVERLPALKLLIQSTLNLNSMKPDLSSSVAYLKLSMQVK